MNPVSDVLEKWGEGASRALSAIPFNFGQPWPSTPILADTAVCTTISPAPPAVRLRGNGGSHGFCRNVRWSTSIGRSTGRCASRSCARIAMRRACALVSRCTDRRLRQSAGWRLHRSLPCEPHLMSRGGWSPFFLRGTVSDSVASGSARGVRTPIGWLDCPGSKRSSGTRKAKASRACRSRSCGRPAGNSCALSAAIACTTTSTGS